MTFEADSHAVGTLAVGEVVEALQTRADADGVRMKMSRGWASLQSADGRTVRPQPTACGRRPAPAEGGPRWGAQLLKRVRGDDETEAARAQARLRPPPRAATR